MKATRALLTAAIVSLVGCGSQVQGQGQEESMVAADKSRSAPPPEYGSSKSAPPKPLSADAAAPTGEPEKDKEKEKRGNTPPGTDRSGGGPASGAIVDPTGATRK